MRIVFVSGKQPPHHKENKDDRFYMRMLIFPEAGQEKEQNKKQDGIDDKGWLQSGCFYDGGKEKRISRGCKRSGLKDGWKTEILLGDRSGQGKKSTRILSGHEGVNSVSGKRNERGSDKPK